MSPSSPNPFNPSSSQVSIRRSPIHSGSSIQLTPFTPSSTTHTPTTTTPHLPSSALSIMNLNVNLNPDLTYPSSSSTTPLTSTTTTKFHFMDTSTLPPSELHDEEGVGSSRAYEEFSTFDWHQGTSSAQRSFHYWGLNLTLLQAWGSVMVIGFLIGVCVAWADVVFEWLYDLKLGRCASFFYLSKKKCCWEQWDEEGSCPDWHEWSYAFFYIRYFPPVNFIIYVLFSSLLASIASYLITSYTPMYGSQSGIAEVKTMLGGFRLHASVVSLKTGWMKWMGLVYAMASGLSIGNKAPLVHIAACWAQGWIHATQSLLRFKKRKNDPEVLHFITCACAAGMAAAFGSPIGGILFTLEEIATFFPIPVMWMAFMCCLCATLMLQILNPFNTGSMVAFQVTRPHEWHLFELMPFAFLGVIGGLTGALFVRWSIRIQLARRRSEFCLKHPILDATYLAFITSFFGYWSALTRDHILSLLAGLFKDCDPNQNYHGICNASPFMNIFSLVYAFLLQFGSSLLTYGAKVPSGIFLPCMAMGACLGRIVGILVSTFQMTFSTSPIFASCQLVDKDCVAPGSYALLGAAAALTGATKLTLSIVVILFELTGALHFVLPTIVVVVVAKFVSDALVGLEGYSTRMVQLNHYPYLETRESYHFTVCVDKIMTHQSLVVLKNGMTVHALRMILSTVSFNTFPIVNDLHSRGLEGCITRRELEEGLGQATSDIQSVYFHPPVPATPIPFTPSLTTSTHSSSTSSTLPPLFLDLRSLTDQSPLTVHPRTHVSVVYQLFLKLGVRYLFIKHKGKLVGLLTKKDMIRYIHASQNTFLHFDQTRHRVFALDPMIDRHQAWYRYWILKLKQGLRRGWDHLREGGSLDKRSSTSAMVTPSSPPSTPSTTHSSSQVFRENTEHEHEHEHEQDEEGLMFSLQPPKTMKE